MVGGGAAAGGCCGAAGGGGMSNAWNKPLISAVVQVSKSDSKSGVHASMFAQDLPRPEFPVTQEACSVQAGADVADEGGWTAVKSKAKSRRLSRTAVKTKDKRVIQQAEFVSEQHHQHTPSKGKSDVTAHARARAEVQVSQDEEPATGKQRRKKKAKNDRGKGVGVLQGVGEVEDEDQQARSNERSNENEERLPSGSPMGQGASDSASSLKRRKNSKRRKKPITPDVEEQPVASASGWRMFAALVCVCVLACVYCACKHFHILPKTLGP